MNRWQFLFLGAGAFAARTASAFNVFTTGIANEENTRFYLGYSGWDAGQLVDELVRNTWAIGDITAEQFLNTPSEQMWSSFVQMLGEPYKMWNRFPKNFEDN